MTEPIRWGILGPGSIAHKFAVGLQAISAGELVAVGSRDQQRADAFADQYGAPNRHASYEALCADPDIDAVYVATPHPFHKDNSILCSKLARPCSVRSRLPSTRPRPKPSSPVPAPMASF